jgi:Flp pilus assembly CpaE family ATPase
LAFVVEPAPPVQVAVPAESDPVPLDSPDPAVDPDEPVPLDEETMPASEFPAAATDDPRAMQSVAEPVSVSTPTEVWFVAEPVVPPKHEVEDLAPDMEVSPEPVFDSAAESTEPAPPAPEPEPPFADIPPAWPDAEAVPAEVVDQATDPPVPEGSGAPRAVPEGYEQFAPMPPPIPDVLDQVLPPPTSPPSTPATSRPTESSTPSHPGSDSRSAPGRVVAVMAGKGGSGKTVTVTNLAIALGLRRDPERVAIVDADLQFGDVALMLQIDPVRTLGDLVGEVESLSDERVDAALLRHKSGTRVLPAPVAPVGSAGISAKSVVEVIDRLRSMFDTVVVDTGPVFDDFLVTVLESADDVVVVVDMDLPSVKNAKVALDGLRQIGFDMGRIRLVMNRADSKVSLDLAEVERTLGLRIGGSIPSDRVIPQGVNDGVPALSRSPRTKVARAFHALAESLDSTEVKDRITGQ